MKVLNPIDHTHVNQYLLDLLDQSSNKADFCASCGELLSDYLEIRNFIVYDNNFELTYQHNLAENISFEYNQVLSQILGQNKVDSIGNCEQKQEQIYIYQENYTQVLEDTLGEYQQWLTQEQVGCLFLSSCSFKNEVLGNLYIEIKSFKCSFSDVKVLLNTVVKFLGICLYHHQLEQKELKLLNEKQKLTQSKKEQSQYLSHMNHELRTPIAAVIGFAKMLQQRLYGELNVKQAQYVDAIYQSGTYLLELISDLLDVSKIQAQKEELSIEKILISELCESALSLVKTKAQEQEIELILDIKPNVEFCFIDQRRLKQVLVNLLSNAVKFTEEGSVTLEVSEDQEYTYFKVIDTGIGIDPESQKKLFQPFSQLNTHIHRKHRGTGLGLVISRELARLHGGDIILESEANKGSCFTVSIPH